MARVLAASGVARVVLLMLFIGGSSWAGNGPVPAAARQETPSAIEVGAGPVREPAFALVGRTVYGDDSARVFGYLTDVIGLDPARLFIASPPSPQTARLTYAGEMALTSNNRGDVTAFAGEGAIQIFLNERGGATWDDPASFAAGEPIATLAPRWSDTLQRQAPGVGVVVGDAPFRQEMAGEFVLGGETYRFGQSGLEGRLRTIGALVDDEAESGLVVALTGSGSITAREAIPVIAGSVDA